MVESSKELIEKMRDVDGFPIGDEGAIIALSDPPYYTSYPNPFIGAFIKKFGKPYAEENDDYQKEPLSSDISEGKNNPMYNAHSYHTKVPHQAIIRYILHYTNPGDIVFDGFAGTGMTGVAAQLCHDPDHMLIKQIESKMNDVEWGVRYAILNDLSPIASFISYNYNNPVDWKLFKKEAIDILSKFEKEIGWMYKTTHVKNKVLQYEVNIQGKKTPIMGEINYTVYSDVFICPNCSSEIIFYNVEKKGRKFICNICSSIVGKNDSDRVFETVYDPIIDQVIKRAKQIPVLINYSVIEHNKKIKYDKLPDEFDDIRIKRINKLEYDNWVPINKIPDGYNTRQPMKSHGLSHIHHFYTNESLHSISYLFKTIREKKSDIKRYLYFSFDQVALGMSKLNRFAPTHYSQVNRILSGTLYIGSQISSVSPRYILENKINRLEKLLKSIQRMDRNNVIISTQSSTDLRNIPSKSVDYIFTDPPFGGNLMYSELNFIIEAWYKIFTNNEQEAVINRVQNKNLVSYQSLMEQCFKEFYRVLKPGRWMTVEFHNSQNSVWIAIQEALLRSGFMVADVRVLDKQQGTFKQVTSSNAVKQDLIISVYKQKHDLLENITLKIESESTVWNFVSEHLEYIPVFVEDDGVVEIINERSSYLLYDRMISFFVQRGVAVPISATEFYAGLKKRFPERDGMFFLPEQVSKYDANRINTKKIVQSYLTIHDEKSAILWLKRFLENKPRRYQEIQPIFLQNLHKYRHESLPELREILEQNFLFSEDGTWSIPDPSKDKDLEQLRNKFLLKQYQEYQKSKGKLKIFRTEAIRIGFSESWINGDYVSIINMAEKIPSAILHEDPTLLMYYDNALARSE